MSDEKDSVEGDQISKNYDITLADVDEDSEKKEKIDK